MATQTWIGGGNNKADNAKDWSPTGVPPNGSMLQMGEGQTLNVSTGQLVGDTIEANTYPGPSQPANSTDIINLSGDVALSIYSGYRMGFDGGTLDINLAPHATWQGSLGGSSQSNITLNGGPGSVFLNQASWGDRQVETINVPVAGNGTFDGGGFIFNKSVGAGQTLIQNDEAGTALNDPTEFHGLVELGFAGVFLNLANADSYSYKNNMLSIYSGSKVIDTLRLQLQTGFSNFNVEKINGGVTLTPYTSSTVPQIPGTLPMHI